MKNFPTLAFQEGFDPASRVWVYPSSRPLTGEETQFLDNQLNLFCRQWTAHNQALRARAEIFQNRLILLMVDETEAGASGCSIDKSVHFLEKLGEHLGVDFFDRLQFGWQENDELCFGNRNELAARLQSGEVGQKTPMLNTLVATKRDLSEKWLLPFEQSWHRRLI